ncbi:MAG: YceI family protein [Acidimicrobiia bacterium]
MSRFVVDPEASRVWIEGSSSVHPIHATASGLVGWVELSRSGNGIARNPGLGGEIRIAVDRLQSGNALVDRETRRRIDARHHPEIVGAVTAAERIGNDRLAVTGDISFRGQICSVSGEITVSWEGERLVVEGDQTFDVRDWGLQPPRVALLRVHPDVRVRIHIAADPAR